jgi:hypothetical protein
MWNIKMGILVLEKDVDSKTKIEILYPMNFLVSKRERTRYMNTFSNLYIPEHNRS